MANIQGAERFEQGGYVFLLHPLPCEESLRGLDLLGTTIIPSLGKLFGIFGGSTSAEDVISKVSDEQIVDLISSALSCSAVLPKLYALFAAHCDVVFTSESRLPVSQSSTVFARRSAAVIAWLVECLRIEYADFLDGSGLKLIQASASRWKSPSGSDPKSGL